MLSRRGLPHPDALLSQDPPVVRLRRCTRMVKRARSGGPPFGPHGVSQSAGPQGKPRRLDRHQLLGIEGTRIRLNGQSSLRHGVIHGALRISASAVMSWAYGCASGVSTMETLAKAHEEPGCQQRSSQPAVSVHLAVSMLVSSWPQHGRCPQGSRSGFWKRSADPNRIGWPLQPGRRDHAAGSPRSIGGFPADGWATPGIPIPTC